MVRFSYFWKHFCFCCKKNWKLNASSFSNCYVQHVAPLISWKTRFISNTAGKLFWTLIFVIF